MYVIFQQNLYQKKKIFGVLFEISVFIKQIF